MMYSLTRRRAPQVPWASRPPVTYGTAPHVAQLNSLPTTDALDTERSRQDLRVSQYLGIRDPVALTKQGAQSPLASEIHGASASDPVPRD